MADEGPVVRLQDDSVLTDGPAEFAVVIPTLNERENVPILAARLAAALDGIAWEAIFVDDDSTDGTIDAIRALSRDSTRIRGLRRVHRRGLAGASLEGMLATSAPYVALIDADLQHDETRLREMLAVLRAGEADVVVASRYVDAGTSDGLSQVRHAGSRLANWFARTLLKTPLTDPMSGFFAIRRDVVEKIAPRLSDQGFKILLDILVSAPAPLRIREIPYVFQPRLHGESKLDAAIVLEYLGLIVAKLTGDLISIRFVMFAFVGASGVVVNLAALWFLLAQNIEFSIAQTGAMLTALTWNYTLNNALTYRDRRRRGWRFLTGLVMFAGLCSVGLVGGVGVSTFIYHQEPRWWLAGLAGAAVGTMWNYITSTAITWRVR
ncbi:MAG TPA: glycosyltransferase [Bauldia sp.]|nr:glycosyltransferase [Bauldia sp.]